MNPNSSIVQLLDQFKPYDDIEAAYKSQLQQFITNSKNPYDRGNLVAHTVADAWVVSPDRSQVLLVHHSASGLWVTPGGHTDGSSDILAAAIRELEEETGITSDQIKPLLNGAIFDLNVGTIPNRHKKHGFEPIHMHFDICFAFEADPQSVSLTISEESLDIQWKTMDEALAIMIDGHTKRAEKTRAGLI